MPIARRRIVFQVRVDIAIMPVPKNGQEVDHG